MRWTFIIFFFLAVFPVFGVDYHFRVLPTDNSGDIKRIHVLFQASDKLMWLGTDRGLYSFDGRAYKYFPREDRRAEQVSTIAEGRDGRIWAGYRDGQMMITDFQGHRQNLLLDSLLGKPVSKIVFLPNGSVMLASYGIGLWKWQHETLQRVTDPLLNQITDFYDALLDHDQQLWLATDDGIYSYKENEHQPVRHYGRQEGLKDDIIKTLALDLDGNLLLGMYDYGVQQMIISQNKINTIKEISPTSGNIVALDRGLERDIWFATENEIWHVSPTAGEQQVAFPYAGKNRIETMLSDGSGNLWVACGNRLYLANTQIENIYPEVEHIQTILTTGNTLWLGCKDGLYSSDFEGHHLQSFLTADHLYVTSIYQDDDGILWIGTYQGLYILDPVTRRQRHLTKRDKLADISISNIDGKGHTVWLATTGGITQIKWLQSPFEPNLDISELQDAPDSHVRYPYDVFVSSSGRVWFGSDGMGLFYLEDDVLHSFPVSYMSHDSLNDTLHTIYSITEDWQQRLWLSTLKGLVLCVDGNGKVQHQVVSSNGALNSVAVTGSKEILMIREGAIYSLDASGQQFVTDESSGLASFVPNLNATDVDRFGSVWIADTNRIVRYHAHNPVSDRKVWMHIETILPGDIREGNTIQLNPDNNFLDVRYSGIWYQDPSQVRYRYKLEGHDPDWIYTQDERVVYSKLAPGEYKFVVQGSHSDDFTQVNSMTRNIIVLPPIYWRWWFVTGVLMMVGALAFSFIRLRIARIKKLHELEKERTTFQLHAIQAQVNPHFLFNSFNTLASIIEEDQQAAVAYVDELSSFFRGALMHRDEELITLVAEMDIVRNYVYILTKRYGENIHIEERIDNLMGWIAPLCIQLLVENAIKHNTVSAERKLSILIAINAQWIEVSNPIQPKFQPSGESTGFGLSSLITRYTYLTPLKIEIRRDHNRFTVKIPVIYPEQTT